MSDDMPSTGKRIIADINDVSVETVQRWLNQGYVTCDECGAEISGISRYSDHECVDKEHDMYRCPMCKSNKEPVRRFSGPPGDGRNMERHCSCCGYHGLIDEWRVNNDD